jgi:hypothetical protein
MAQQLAHSGMNLADAQKHAMARFYASVQAQAAALAYIDIYFVIAVAAGIMFLLSSALRANNPRAAAKVTAH